MALGRGCVCPAAWAAPSLRIRSRRGPGRSPARPITLEKRYGGHCLTVGRPPNPWTQSPWQLVCVLGRKVLLSENSGGQAARPGGPCGRQRVGVGGLGHPAAGVKQNKGLRGRVGLGQQGLQATWEAGPQCGERTEGGSGARVVTCVCPERGLRTCYKCSGGGRPASCDRAL